MLINKDYLLKKAIEDEVTHLGLMRFILTEDGTYITVSVALEPEEDESPLEVIYKGDVVWCSATLTDEDFNAADKAVKILIGDKAFTVYEKI